MVHRLLQIHTSAATTTSVRDVLTKFEPVWWREHETQEDRVLFEALVEVGREQVEERVLDEPAHHRDPVVAKGLERLGLRRSKQRSME